MIKVKNTLSYLIVILAISLCIVSCDSEKPNDIAPKENNAEEVINNEDPKNNEDPRKCSCRNGGGDWDYLDGTGIGWLRTNETSQKYQNIWKELFLERNGLSEEFFDKHIELKTSFLNEWDDGTSFSIGYYIKVDWAVAYNMDNFIINITNEEIYPASNNPTNRYLTKEEVAEIVNRREYFSEIIKLTPDETLKFATKDEAMDFLIKEANVSTLCLLRIFVNTTTGHLILEATAQYENESNKCIFAFLDLVNGETNIYDSLCYMTGCF